MVKRHTKNSPEIASLENLPDTNKILVELVRAGRLTVGSKLRLRTGLSQEKFVAALKILETNNYVTTQMMPHAPSQTTMPELYQIVTLT